MRRFHAALPILAVALSAGCSTHRVPDTLDPGVAEAAIAGTTPDRPLRMVVDWRIQDGEARFSGSGVARIQPPLRARLDLFGPRGDGYLSAALVDFEIRLPPGVDAPRLPPSAMMWAVLGVVAPPEGAVLAGTRDDPARTELHYTAGDGRLRYTLEQGRLWQVLWDGPGGRMVVELRGTADFGVPREALYRDLSAYTELMLNLESVDEVDPYPPETWTPGA
jgi:hypothetical protein